MGGAAQAASEGCSVSSAVPVELSRQGATLSGLVQAVAALTQKVSEFSSRTNSEVSNTGPNLCGVPEEGEGEAPSGDLTREEGEAPLGASFGVSDARSGALLQYYQLSLLSR